MIHVISYELWGYSWLCIIY